MTPGIGACFVQVFGPCRHARVGGAGVDSPSETQPLRSPPSLHNWCCARMSGPRNFLTSVGDVPARRAGNRRARLPIPAILKFFGGQFEPCMGGKGGVRGVQVPVQRVPELSHGWHLGRPSIKPSKEAAGASPTERTGHKKDTGTGSESRPGLAQLRVNAPALGAVSAVAGYFAPSSEPDATPAAEDLLWLSTAQGSAGSSTSGPGSGGAQAAGDAAGLWSPWEARSSAQAPDLAQAPATSPSFDPGSSPD